MAYKQSDTSPVLAPGCEELKCDVVGISKRQCRAGRRVHDATVGDAEFVEPDVPRFQLIAGGTARRQMKERRPPRVERLSPGQLRELLEATECAARTPPD